MIRYHLKFYNILFKSWLIIAASCSREDIITSIIVSNADTVVKCWHLSSIISFFPQLVAGPIERSKNLLKQLAEPMNFKYENVRTGLLTMLWGFFIKLVIADRAAVLVDTVYNNYQAYSGFQLVVSNVLFAVQIYCDFMGYSIIAKGAAKVMGYHLMDNFNRPYFAQSIKEFWRRWHISLSSWFRDYLYIPLGGSRCSKGRKYVNLMITFLVSGLWHGANGTFVLWRYTVYARL